MPGVTAPTAIVTDLSISFNGMTDEEITERIMKSEDEPILKQYVAVIVHDIRAIYDPYQGAHDITIRDIAVDAVNRAKYFDLRIRSTNPIVHETLDMLMQFNIPTAGSMVASLRYVPEGHTNPKMEILGMYSFDRGFIYKPELRRILTAEGYEPMRKYH